MATFMRGHLSTQPLAVRAASACLYHAAAHSPAPQEGYVPGLHQTALARLAAHGYHTSVQLMGAFLLRMRSREEFCKLLVEAGGMEKACVAGRVACSSERVLGSSAAPSAPMSDGG
jgi:hypothetical protein